MVGGAQREGIVVAVVKADSSKRVIFDVLVVLKPFYPIALVENPSNSNNFLNFEWLRW